MVSFGFLKIRKFIRVKVILLYLLPHNESNKGGVNIFLTQNVKTGEETTEDSFLEAGKHMDRD